MPLAGKSGIIAHDRSQKNSAILSVHEKRVMKAHELFEKGREFLNDDNTLAALACFEKAYSMEKLPGIQSYMGICVALERGQIKEGIQLCNDAIAEDPGNPVPYLHLGKIHIKAGKKDEAIAIMRKGLSFGDSEEIRKILDDLGTRRKPFFPFLSRKNVLNKYAGLLRSMLRIR